MEDHSSIHPYSNHQHLHRPSLRVTIPNYPSPELGYFSSQPPLEPLEQYGSIRVMSSGSISTPNIFPGVSGQSSADSVGYVSVSGNSLDGDASVGSQFDADGGLKSHFNNSWYGGYNKGQSWDEGESSRRSPVEDFYQTGNKNDLHYFRSCEDVRDGVYDFATVKVEADYDNFSCKAKDKSVYCREANMSHYSKHRGSTFAFSDAKSTESHLGGGEEEFGSGWSRGDDPSQQAELKPHGSWLTPFPSPSQAVEPGADRCRAGTDSQAPAACQPPHTQKLDSFSEAFLSQRKRGGFPLISDPMSHMWRFWLGKGEEGGPGLITSSSHASCVLDTPFDSRYPPSSSPSLPSLSPPPPTSHHMPSVLSPPPTPLPPLSLSPSNVDSFGGVGYSALKGLGPLGMLQFFPPHVQSLASGHPSGAIWKLPLQSHCLPQQTGDSESIGEGHLRSSHFANHNNSPQTPEAPFFTSSSSPSSTRPSVDASQILSHLSGRRYEAGKRLTPYVALHKVQNGSLGQSHQLETQFEQTELHVKHEMKRTDSRKRRGGASFPSTSCLKSRKDVRHQLPFVSNVPTVLLRQHVVQEIYTGTPFPSVLHSSRGFRKAHYIPRPILNPKRRGTGLYASLSSFHVEEEQTASSREEGKGCELLPCINVGPDSQADIPPRVLKWEESRTMSPNKASPRERLLWKPRKQLERGNSNTSQLQVESLLSMCSSSCLPGGGSNIELALHCLHHCQGDTMATLEMLLFSQPAPTEDYHYSGSDLWTDSEKDLFNTALVCYGKDFSLIQNTVRTKSARQCVELYFLQKKRPKKQRKRKDEEDRNGEGAEQQARVAPFPQPMNSQLGLDRAFPAPLLASFFPCKLCGKMFYKIKSRNAHMKIHRQPQEDWSERRQQQHQLLTQHLAGLMSQNVPPSLCHSDPLQPQASLSAYPACSASASDNSSSNGCTSVSHGDDHPAMVTYGGAVNDPNAHGVQSPGDVGGDSNQDATSSAVSFQQSWELVWKQP